MTGFFASCYEFKMLNNDLKKDEETIIVIGGGASGMMSAGRAAELGAKVLLLEKTNSLGQKILISGKYRCNLSNIKDIPAFIEMFGNNGVFLHRAFRVFFREELLEFFMRYGVATKLERGGRIFPASEKAGDVVDSLMKYLKENNVDILTNKKVESIGSVDGCVKFVRTTKGELFQARAVILATGGATYPATGSTGDGYAIAASLGHTVTKLRPSLVPLVVKEVNIAMSMQDLALRNVRLTSFGCIADDIDHTVTPNYDIGRGLRSRKTNSMVIESRHGEILITHFGLGGPITLLMSLAIVESLEKGPVSVSIDMKPGLSRDELHKRIQRDLDRAGRNSFRYVLKGLLPMKMIDPFINMTGIPSDKMANKIDSVEREIIVGLLKSIRFNIKSPLPISSAIITSGGVSLKEIDPRTMSSRLIKGLFFCGEVMDIDADTGGYNLQAAFSTGYLAGESAAAYVNNKFYR